MHYAVLITGTNADDFWFHKALAAGFEIIGTFQSQPQIGVPTPTVWVVLRRSMRAAHQAGVVDTRAGERPRDDWFE